MDRRQKKTRDAIFKAFSSLLEKNVMKILRYRKLLIKLISVEVLFMLTLRQKMNCLERCVWISFTMCLQRHFLKKPIMITQREVKIIFMNFFREYLKDLFLRYQEDFQTDVPHDYLLNHLVSSFAETVKWWMLGKERYSPEEVAGFYMKVIEGHT